MNLKKSLKNNSTTKNFFYKLRKKIDTINTSYILVSFFILIIVIALCVFIDTTHDFNKGFELTIVAVITICSTFVGISIPLAREDSNRKQDEKVREEKEQKKDRRIRAFMLGLIWNELRVDLIYLKDIKKIYDFNRLSPARLDTFLSGIWKQISGINNIIKNLKSDSFVASQNSGAVTRYDTDDLFNSVQSAYENINHFKFGVQVVVEDMSIKQYFLDKGYFRSISAIDEKNLRDTIKSNLDQREKELNKAIKIVSDAVDKLDKKLDSMNIKAEEV